MEVVFKDIDIEQTKLKYLIILSKMILKGLNFAFAPMDLESINKVIADLFQLEFE